MKRILTIEQRTHILETYRTGGRIATRPLCRRYGVSENYVFKQLVKKHGVKVINPQNKVRPKPPKWDDPRWQRAIDIGPINV